MPVPPRKKSLVKKPAKVADATPDPAKLFGDLRTIIETGRGAVAQAVNAGLVLLYWSVGDRIRREILGEKRAKYGEEIVVTVSRQLTQEYGKGFSQRNLFNMIELAEAFPELRILQTLSAKLGWSHFLHLIPMKDDLKRDFYAEMCRLERWSVRTLRDKIRGMMYERTAISKKPEKLIRAELDALRDEDRMTPDLVFRDPYVLDFLHLPPDYQESDVELGILRELESVILELGSDFAFVARQKRMPVDRKDYYLDLLFYHRRLHRLVGVELKMGAFEAADKGQMELYLGWRNRHERGEGEEKPIGLILCAGKKDETIELLDMEQDGIRVSAYWKEVLPKEQLRQKLHEAVIHARARLASSPQSIKHSK